MKTYSGKIIEDENYVTVHDDQAGNTYSLPPRLDLRNHSPTGFAWGYHGSGPAQLALAILVDHTQGAIELIAPVYQDFKQEVIARFPQNDPWDLTSDFIAKWCKKKMMPISPTPWQAFIQVPESAWEQTGPEDDPAGRLLTTIDINGCSMHLEAYAVEYGEQTETTFGEQHFADSLYYEDCEHGFYSFVEDAAKSIEIKGREYVLIATPFQA